jgi:hypothetical protein
MGKIRNNDLTHYFFRDHKELPEEYLKSCREFFTKIGLELKENNSTRHKHQDKK